MRIYHRFAKLVPASELSKWFKEEDFENYDETILATPSSCQGKATFEFYQKLRIKLTIVQNGKAPIFVYPLRMSGAYICSQGNSHKVLGSSTKLYQYLITKGISSSDELEKEFKGISLLDFEKIAKLIPGSSTTQEPLFQYQVDETDLRCKEIDSKGSSLWAVPCLFEDLIYLEFLVHYTVISKEFKDKIVKAESFEEITDLGFSAPAEVYDETFAELPFSI